MPTRFWPWAVQHSCFITNRLYCTRTKKIPLIDFLQSLNQPHVDKIDFSNLPRFGCRAYKLICHKPGKFEPRAVKGWFLGFQPNTNKNYTIYHPQHTPSQGYKWIMSFTPHVTFNEDVMFCEKSEHQSQYQSSDHLNSTLNFPSPNYQANIPLTTISQPTPQVEGEHQPHPLEDVATEHQAPLSEDITNELSQSQHIINDLISHGTTPITSPIITPTHPIATESNSLLPKEAQNPSQPASIIDEFSIAELTTPSSPTQPTELQLSYPSSNDEQTQSHDEEVLPYQLDIYHQQEKPNNKRDL